MRDFTIQKTEGKVSPVQRKAIEHASGPVQVLAGPGSGKTFLMIRRVRHLICHHGISPDKILVITFARAAALEMQERFQKLTEGAYPSVCFGTFHAVYYHILKSGNGKTDYTPISSKEKTEYLKHSLAVCGLTDIAKDTLEKLSEKISKAKNSIALAGEESFPVVSAYGKETEEDAIEEYFPAILKEYGRIMEENRKLDFDDMILLCDRMLTENEKLLSDWQARFSHILVDEFQDIGPVQYRILQKLAAPEHNLFVVGDDDQSIYGFRGAGPDIMRQFIRDYPEAARFFLEMNYRSGEKIVRTASLLIEDNQNRFAKNLQAEKKGKEEVRLCFFSSWEEEADYLIGELRNMSEDELKKTAVICRTHIQSRNFTEFLAKRGIPFQIYGKTEHLLKHPIAEDFLAYLQFAADISGSQCRNGKRSDFLRIMNKPGRYIHRAAAGKRQVSEQELLEYYREIPYMQQRLKRFFADLKKAAEFRPYLATDYIRKKMGYDSYLCGRREGQRTWMEIADCIQETQKGLRSLDEWKEYMDSYEKQLKEKKKDVTGVAFITMHSAKGLEYDNVFLPDVNAKTIPHKKAIWPEQIEEERRLLYVAMTRARKRLEIFCSGQPSFFLEKLKSSPEITIRP